MGDQKKIRPGVGLFGGDVQHEVDVPELGAVFLVSPLTDALQRKYLGGLEGETVPMTQNKAGDTRVEVTLRPEKQRVSMLALRLAVIHGWLEGFADSAGNEIACTPENLEIFLEEDELCEPVMVAARALAVQVEEETEGN